MCLDAKGVNIALGRYGFANDGSAGDPSPTPQFSAYPKGIFWLLRYAWVIYGMKCIPSLRMFKGWCIKFLFDGRNPAPVDMVTTPLLGGFHTCQLVSRHFFHQQIANSRGLHTNNKEFNVKGGITIPNIRSLGHRSTLPRIRGSYVLSESGSVTDPTNPMTCFHGIWRPVNRRKRDSWW